jgi:GNAT superfamily N-acetyltransferase
MSDTERKWSVRAYHDGDEEGIFELWKAVYPENPYDRQQWLRWWHWMYRANPTGIGVICVAEHDGRVVGHAAEVPLVMKIGCENVLVGLGIDAMTHPEYRRQGMYLAVVKTRRALGEACGIRATYAFPNKLSYPGQMMELSAFDIATMQKVVKPLNWRNAMRTQTKNRLLIAIGAVAGRLLCTTFFRTGKAPSLKGLNIAQVSHFDERIDGLWRKASSPYQVIVVRNREYLNWRYAAVPDADYLIYVAEQAEAIVGYLVVSRKQADQASIGVILDVFTESEEIAQCLISEAVTRCRQEKLDLLYGARMAGTPLARAFRQNGFLPVPFVKAIRITGRSVSSGIAEQLQNPKNWFLQIGDSDET